MNVLLAKSECVDNTFEKVVLLKVLGFGREQIWHLGYF